MQGRAFAPLLLLVASLLGIPQPAVAAAPTPHGLAAQLALVQELVQLSDEQHRQFVEEVQQVSIRRSRDPNRDQGPVAAGIAPVSEALQRGIRDGSFTPRQEELAGGVLSLLDATVELQRASSQMLLLPVPLRAVVQLPTDRRLGGMAIAQEILVGRRQRSARLDDDPEAIGALLSWEEAQARSLLQLLRDAGIAPERGSLGDPWRAIGFVQPLPDLNEDAPVDDEALVTAYLASMRVALEGRAAAAEPEVGEADEAGLSSPRDLLLNPLRPARNRDLPASSFVGIPEVQDAARSTLELTTPELTALHEFEQSVQHIARGLARQPELALPMGRGEERSFRPALTQSYRVVPTDWDAIERALENTRAGVALFEGQIERLETDLKVAGCPDTVASTISLMLRSDLYRGGRPPTIRPDGSAVHGDLSPRWSALRVADVLRGLSRDQVASLPRESLDGLHGFVAAQQAAWRARLKAWEAEARFGQLRWNDPPRGVPGKEAEFQEWARNVGAASAAAREAVRANDVAADGCRQAIQAIGRAEFLPDLSEQVVFEIAIAEHLAPASHVVAKSLRASGGTEEDVTSTLERYDDMTGEMAAVIREWERLGRQGRGAERGTELLSAFSELWWVRRELIAHLTDRMLAP